MEPAALSVNELGFSAVQASPPAAPGTAILFAAITGLGMLAGVWSIRRFEGWAIRHAAELVAFAAGLLVSGALLHLVPQSVELLGSETGLAWTLVAFVALYLAEAHFVPHVHGRGEGVGEELRHGDEHIHPLGLIVVLSLGIHSVVDGVSVGAGLAAGAVLGTVTALLVVVHKLPVGIAAMSALYHSGMPGRRAMLICAGLAAITPVAVILSYLSFRSVSDRFLGTLLALAAGSFLYVGAADLLPEGQARGRAVNTVMFLVGASLMVVVKLGVG